MQHFQCALKAVDGSEQTTGWIEERAAKLGAHVELKEQKRLYEVTQVYLPSLDSEVLRANQIYNRDSLPSIRNH